MAEETNPVKEPQDKPTLETSPLEVDKPIPEAISDELPADDSSKAENTGGETPLHKLLLRMAKDDKGLTREADFVKLSGMLRDGVQVNAKNANGETALHLAAANGLVEAATRLMKAGANVSELDNEKRQPLHKACSKDHVAVVKLLLDNGADTQITEKDGWSPLHFASRRGHKGVIQALLDKDKTNINATEALEGWTALNLAIYHGNDDAVLTLLKEGANVGTQDNDGWTPLMTAIKKKHERIVEELLNQKEDLQLETRNKSGHTPLLSASINGFSAGARLLIKAGADCNVRSIASESPPLISASCWGYRGIVQALLEPSDRTDVNIQDVEGWAALHYASNRGHSKVVEILLQHQANFELVSNDGETPLHLASRKGNEDVVKLLLDAGANVDVTGQDGDTALHLASGARPEDRSKQDDDDDDDDDEPSEEKEVMEFRSGQHAAVVKLLLEHGADPDAKTNKNETALHLAATRGDPIRLEFILANMKEESMSTRDDQDRTALYLACTGDSPASAVESLLKSDKLRTAVFGTRNVENDKIEQAANHPETHEIARGLMRERSRGKEMAQPAGSDNWSVIEWAAYSELPEVLSPLLAQSPGSSDIHAALKSTLESTLESARRSMHEPREETGQNKLLKVLSLLLAKSPATPEIDAALESALKLRKKAENQNHDPKQRSIPPDISKSEAGASSNKGKGKNPEDRSEMTTRTAKDRQTNYLNAIIDILQYPPFLQTHKDSRIDSPVEPSREQSNILENFEATMVQLFKGKGESGTFRRSRSLKEVIYGKGPKEIMKDTILDLRKIFDGLPELSESLKYLNTELKFTWVHLPATNMVWMNDIFIRIMNYGECEGLPYHELKSFFRDSWTQVPDRTSLSRSMRPRTVVRRQENEAGGENDTIKEEKKKDSGKESNKAKSEAKQEGVWQRESKPDFGSASATYMPYFCFSTKYWDKATPGEEQKKFNDMKTAYGGLKGSKSPVIHESPTLDEWYYQFANDKESQKDRKSRNRGQIVTKAIEGRKTTEGDDKTLEKSNEITKKGKEKEPEKWTLLRINQVWAWTIANKWLITATPCSFDGSNGTLVEGILEQLGKEAEAGGSASQPDSAADMCRYVIDYCIGSYERLSKNEEPNPDEPKPQGQGSIRQIFSNTINKIGRDETALFEDFRNQTQRWQGQTTNEREEAAKMAPFTTDESSSRGSLENPYRSSSDAQSQAPPQVSTNEYIRDAIKRAEKMYCEIKDTRDELNILKSVVQYQKAVEEGLTSGSLDVNLAAAYVVNDLKEMENSAERIQSAINTTLSLLQSRLSNHLADLATQQGKTLMAFTVVTILFLPLSFLSSLFALDVASFLQAPGWAFAVIFAVSLAFSIITALVAQRWEKISSHLEELGRLILQAWKSIKPGSKSSEEANVDEAEDKSTGQMVPETPKEPRPGETSSRKAPLLLRLRGGLRRRQSDAV